MPNLTVTSNATAHHNGSYEATDTGAGDGSATVEGSAVTADEDGFRVTNLSGTATTDANADVTIDIMEEDTVSLENTGITAHNGGRADINGWGNVSVSGAGTTNGITNTGDVATDTLRTTGDTDMGGGLSVPVGWRGFDLSYPE